MYLISTDQAYVELLASKYAGKAVVPPVGNVTEIVDFSVAPLVISGGKISQTTGQNGGLFTSLDSSHQPTLVAGSVGQGYAHFNGASVGAPLPSGRGGVQQTIISLFRSNSLSTYACQSGGYVGAYSPPTGFGIFNGGTDPNKNSGVMLYGVAEEDVKDTGNSVGFWQINAGVYDGTNDIWYDGCCVPHIASSAVPIDPVGGSLWIGEIPGIGYGYCDVQYTVFIKGALNFSQIQQWYTYLFARFLSIVPVSPVSVVTDGDSITWGYEDSQSYPSRLAALLRTSGKNIGMSNVAVVGYTSAQLLSGWSARVSSFFNSFGNSWYVLMVGHNDNATGVTASVSYANILALVGNALALNARVLLITVLPTTDYGTGSAGQWTALNSLIMGTDIPGVHVLNEAVASWAVDPTNATYYNGGVHLTDAGAANFAADVEAYLVTQL